MNLILIYAGLALFVVLLITGTAQFMINSTDQRRVVAATLAAGATQDAGRSRFQRWDRRFAATRLGRFLERDLQLAGIRQPPLVVFVAMVALTILVPVLLAQFLAPAIGVVGLVAGYFVFRVWVSRARDRRREKFVQQIPELARVLSNATNAGLSIATSWVVAEEELAEPAKSEIRRLNAAVRFGASLEDAMLQLNDRLPSREVRVLMSTLVVSARAGGSLVTALREISQTLDDRKEARREVRTTLAQARSTSVLVTALGVLLLFLLNVIQPGTVERMTRNGFGIAALVVAFGLFAVGQFAVYRMTRIER